MHPANDVRIYYKEAMSLSKAGFHIVHICPEHISAKNRFYNKHIKTITYHYPQGIIWRLFQIPSLFRRASKVKADCYHCNEVDSWIAGVLLKICFKKKVVFDVHEHYPETFAHSRFPKWLRPIIAFSIRWLFLILSPFTDRIVLAKQSIAKDFSLFRKKLVYVQNYALTSYLSTNQKQSEPNSLVQVIHHGVMGQKRGWPVLLEVFSSLRHEAICLKIIGQFKDGSENDFFTQRNELNLSERVIFEDWMPFEDVFQHVKASQIGIVLLQPGHLNHVHALPHKLFDYMLAGIPVIIPNFSKELTSIVTQSNCGVLVDPSNPNQIRQAILSLANNPNKRKELGANGRKAILKKYNWDNEARELITMYNKLFLIY